MWKCFWDWLASLPQGSAAFVGTLTGSAFGLIALLLGALFNARLNRKRDEALREADRVAVASALSAELTGIHQSFVDNAKHVTESPPAKDGGFLIPIPKIRVFPEMMSQIGLLRPDTIKAVMGGYILTEQYHYKLILLGGRAEADMPEEHQLVYLGSEHTKNVVALNEVTAEVVKEAIDSLASYLKAATPQSSAR
jgi:hypothetical protein